MQSCWIGSPRWSTIATAMRAPRARASAIARSASASAHSCSGWWRRGRVRVAEALLGRAASPNASSQRCGVVAVLALVGRCRAPTARAGPRRSPACRRRDQLAAVDAGCRRTARRVAPDAAMPATTTPSSSDRHPARAGEARLGRAGRRSRLDDRRREACASGAGARCSGSAGWPRSTPWSAARAMPPAPPRSIRDAETSTPLAPTTATPPRTPEVLGLVDRALDQRARRVERDVSRVQSPPVPPPAPAVSPTAAPGRRAGRCCRPA